MWLQFLALLAGLILLVWAMHRWWYIPRRARKRAQMRQDDRVRAFMRDALKRTKEPWRLEAWREHVFSMDRAGKKQMVEARYLVDMRDLDRRMVLICNLKSVKWRVRMQDDLGMTFEREYTWKHGLASMIESFVNTIPFRRGETA